MQKIGRYFFGLSLCASILVSGSTEVRAQGFEVFSYDKPFIPLAQLPYRTGAIEYVNFPSFSGNRFVENLPIGFSFNYFGSTYDRFGVSPHGWVGFIRGSSDSFANVAMGSPLRPNGFIAPWWDDLKLGSLNFGTSYAIFGTAPHRALVIETRNFSASPNVNDGGIWQVWLYESPANENARFEIRVDGDLSDSYSASVGFEGVQGLLGQAFLPCTPNCSAADADLSLKGKAFTVHNASGPELVGQIDQSPRGLLPQGTANVQATVFNIGASVAQTVSVKLFLSSDNAFDNNDVMLAQATINGLAADSSVQETMSITSPAGLTSGDYYLLLEVDDNQSVAQSFRLDDHIVAKDKFANAYDIEVFNVAPQSSANPSEALQVQFDVKQNGAPYSGNVGVSVYLSPDQTFDATDLQVTAPATITLNGSPEQQITVNGTTPANLAPGQYYAIVLLDNNQQISEHNEFNNRASSLTLMNSGPDLFASAVQVPVTVSPGGSTQITTTIDSTGVPYTGTVDYVLYASIDSSLNTVTDYNLGSFQAQFTGQAQVSRNESITIPANIAPGAYFVFAVVDPSNQIAETLESNNEFLSLARFLTHTDLSVSNVTGPAAGQPGEQVTINFDVQALGQTVSGSVDYRIYLSSNPTLGSSDLAVFNGSTALTNGTIASVEATFALPPNTLIRQWRILVEVDPDNLIIESAENNNVSASLSSMLVSGSDLRFAPPLIGSNFAFIGQEYRLRGEIENVGIAEAVNFKYAVYFSENEVIGTADRQLFLSQEISLDAGDTFSFDENIMIPGDLSEGSQYLGVIVDILSSVPETSELNNAIAFDSPIQIVPPSPDLVANLIGSPSSTAPGETINVTRLLDNTGVLDATGVKYSYYLSADENVTSTDILLSQSTADLFQGQSDFRSDTMVIPNGVVPGTYYLGLIVDPGQDIQETDETNNVSVSSAVQIFRPSIEFINEQFPRAIIGIQYEVGVFVAGITRSPSLSVSSGQLPPGLSIDQTAGYIRGIATTEGLFEFTLRASSNLSADSYVEQRFSIRAAQPTKSLSIATDRIPLVLTQKEYNTPLLAEGGIAPFKWTTTSSLPEGLSFSSEGRLSGTALITGQYDFDVTVVDDNGDLANKSLKIYVLTPRQTVQIRQSDLPFGIVEKDYCELATIVLRAERGIEPYVWSIDGEAPGGMTLSEDGRLCGTPTRPGDYTLKVRVTDQTGVFDSTSFFLRISAGEAFAVSTFALPYTTVGEPYESEITAVRGNEPYIFSIEQGELPPGIMMTDGGSLSGTATSTGTYAFITKVVDASGRQRQQALSIIVYRAGQTDSSCACNSSGEPTNGWLSLALVFAIFCLLYTRREHLVPQRVRRNPRGRRSRRRDPLA